MLSEYHANQGQLTTPQPQSTQPLQIQKTEEPQSFELSGHLGAVNCVDFNKITGLLASGDAEGHVFIWDPSQPPDKMNISNHKFHKNEVLDITWFNNNAVLTASADGTAKIYDIIQNKTIRTVSHSIGAINAVKAFPSHSNPYLFITAGDNGAIFVWDSRFSDPVHEIITRYPVTSIEADPSLTFLYAAGVDDTIYAFDLVNGKVFFTLKGHTDTVLSLYLSQDNTLLVSYALDGSIRMWDIRPVVPEHRLKNGRLVTQFTKGPKQSRKHQQLHRAMLISTKINTANKIFMGVVAASDDGNAFLFDLQQKDQSLNMAKIPLHKGSCNDIDYYNGLLASGGADGKVIVGKMYF